MRLRRIFPAPFFLAGCATMHVAMKPVETRGDREALVAASEAFYSAGTAKEMRDAVEAARAVDATAALYHELAAALALYEARWDDRFDHLFEALRDPTNDVASLHLELIDEVSWTRSERKRIEALVETLAREHPDAAVRAKASDFAVHLLHLRDDRAGRERARDAIALRLPMAVVGTWDNEQGKGFDVELPPEKAIDFDATYDGVLVETRWRRDPRTSLRGPALDLAALFSPSEWALAYATAAVVVETAGEFELRVASSVPFKIWVDGALVFEDRTVDRTMFDQFVFPMRLETGPHRVLVKSAQNKGPWTLAARVTGPRGEAPVGIRVAPVDLPIDVTHPTASTFDAAGQVDARVRHLPQGSIRRNVLAIEWARKLGLPKQSTSIGDAFVAKHPTSIVGRALLVGELWDDGERGRVADMYATLDAEVGRDLPYIRMQAARFQSQEGMIEEARSVLVTLKNADPKNAETWLRLSRQFAEEEWKEDECRALEQAELLRPDWYDLRLERAGCLESQGFVARAEAIYRDLRAELPNEGAAARRLLGIELDRGNFPMAERLAERLVRARPNDTSAWLRLADVRRKKGDTAGAEGALFEAIQIDPDLASAWRELGRLAYERKDEALAVERWQAALTRNPEDAKLANRLSFLAAGEKEAWERDVPDTAAIAEAIASKKNVEVGPGANVVELLDHEVTRINLDGSTVNYVTRVLYALNESGRDEATTIQTRQGGRMRLLNAYAIDPDGKRTQVSSVRDRTARFRGLKVGSIVVLQFRHDEKPIGYLARHIARTWWFNSAAHHVRKSEWIVWAPKATHFHEAVRGTIEREENVVGDTVRLVFRATDVPPIIAEPQMPTPHETYMNLELSTVPDWDTFLEWEKALLHDAFRESAEVEELAARLFLGLATKKEKVERIHRYLMEEVRYQQDYEDSIAGVKPHPATVVIQRAYGDCKDKAVLFITLARLAGIDAEFAILRTRSRGPLSRDVPMQQFNHAIVYVPEQAGISEGRFYDPTADALDVDTLPTDDPGTTALVFDTKSEKHRWIEIPYQAPDLNRNKVVERYAITTDGSAAGVLEIEARGSEGSFLRRLARNERQTRQAMQLFVGQIHPGANIDALRMPEIEDLAKPARVSMKVASPSHARREGSQLRVRTPSVWSPDRMFQLSERKYALVLGVPHVRMWRTELDIPETASVVRLPASGHIEARCFSLVRKIEAKGGHIVIDQEFRNLCERIPADEYTAHKERAEEMTRFMNEELVLETAAKKAGPRKATARTSQRQDVPSAGEPGRR